MATKKQGNDSADKKREEKIQKAQDKKKLRKQMRRGG